MVIFLNMLVFIWILVELFDGLVGFWEEEIGDNEELFVKYYFDKLDYLEFDVIYIFWIVVLCDGEIVFLYEI